jgi:hypothetical protein
MSENLLTEEELKCKEKEQENKLSYLIEHCEDFVLEED